MGQCVLHIKPPVRVERRRMVGRAIDKNKLEY